jgi:pyridoxine kinase
MNLLSIQSHVAYGHVGNSAAVFPLQRLGVEVWPVDTVQFAYHAGYGSPPGHAFDGATVAALVGGIDARGVLAGCDGILSGYIGTVPVGEAILDAVALVKRRNPRTLYGCDPVIGDAGGRYVPVEVEAFFRQRALPAADVLTPNRFELETLSSRKIVSTADAFAAIDLLRSQGPRIIVATSVTTSDTPAGHIDILAGDAQQRLRVRTPFLPVSVSGTGDMLSALFLAHYLRSGSLAEAVSLAVSSVYGVIEATAAQAGRELLLVAAQAEIATPSRIFPAEPVGAAS